MRRSVAIGIALGIGVGIGIMIELVSLPSMLLRKIRVRSFGRHVELAQPSDSGVPASSWLRRFRKGELVTVMVVGQSQAANFGEIESLQRDSTWVLLSGRVHRSSSPLPGAEGRLGSAWPRLGGRVAGANGQTLLVIPVAVGATTMRDWTPAAPGGRLVQRAMEGASELALRIDATLLMVGEADAMAGTTSKAWGQSFGGFRLMVQNGGVAPPIFVAQETRCFDVAVSQHIQRAQRDVVDSVGVFAGPKLDDLGPEFRWDGCHFTGAGLDSLAVRWMRVLAERGVVRRHVTFRRVAIAHQAVTRLPKDVRRLQAVPNKTQSRSGGFSEAP